MKQFLATLLIQCLFLTNALAAGKLQDQDFKTSAQLITAGATKASLLNDTKIYVTANNINNDLNSAISGGLIGGNCTSLLQNGCFETGTGSWTNVNGVYTVTTTAGEFSEGFQGAKIALTAQALNFSQSVNTLLGSSLQYVIGAQYKIPSAVIDFQVCTLIAGVEKTCVPSANLIADGLYHSIEIPEVITAGSTVGIKFKTTASYTQNVFFDSTYIKQGLGIQALQLDNVYSANISTGGVISGESKDFINGNCTAANPSVCTFTSGVFTVAPICQVTMLSSGAQRIPMVSAISSTSVSVTEQVTSGAMVFDQPLMITCQKSTTDYAAASSAAYSQASANYGWTLQAGGNVITGTTTNPVKATTPTTDEVWFQRSGGDLEVRFAYRQTSNTGAASGSGDYKFQIPTASGCIIDTTKIKTNSIIVAQGITMGYSTDSLVGSAIAGSKTNSQQFIGSMHVYDGTFLRMSGIWNTGGTGAYTQTLGSSGNIALGVAGELSYSANYKVPCVGWSNASQIVGSFAGYANVPGYQGNIDTFSVSYGAGTSSTSCAASTTCTLYNQIGTSISSIVQAGAGVMTTNFSKTYTKLNCTGSALGAADVIIDPATCSNCNSLSWIARNTVAGGAISYGTLNCMGTF
jgi:hypothetical protein